MGVRDFTVFTAAGMYPLSPRRSQQIASVISDRTLDGPDRAQPAGRAQMPGASVRSVELHGFMVCRSCRLEK